MMYHETLENNRPSRWQEIIQIREDINKIEAGNNTQSQPKDWFFEKLNKVDNLPGKMTKKEKTQINKIGDVECATTDSREIKNMIREKESILSACKFAVVYNQW